MELLYLYMMVLKLGMISVPGVCCTTRTQFHDPRMCYIPDGTGYHVRNQKLRTPVEAKLPDDDNQASPPAAAAADDDDNVNNDVFAHRHHSVA
jgi:hypothetical protein